LFKLFSTNVTRIIFSHPAIITQLIEQVLSSPLRNRGFETKLSDAKVIMMENIGEFIGKDQDKSLWRYFRNHSHDWFPTLGSRTSFVKECKSVVAKRTNDEAVSTTNQIV
jgi:hypothetical protein